MDNARLVNPFDRLANLSRDWDDPFLIQTVGLWFHLRGGKLVVYRKIGLTYQSSNTSATTVLRNHPHCLTNRDRSNHTIDIFGLIFAQDLQGIDLFEEFAIRICRPGIDGITFIDIDDFDSHGLSGFHVLA